LYRFRFFKFILCMYTSIKSLMGGPETRRTCTHRYVSGAQAPIKLLKKLKRKLTKKLLNKSVAFCHSLLLELRVLYMSGFLYANWFISFSIYNEVHMSYCSGYISLI
jgi:hypothetical protein